MGSDDEFGPDTMTIRAWLDKRATYAADRDVPLPPIELPSGGAAVAAQEHERSAPRLPDTHDAGRSVLDALGPIVIERAAEPPAEPMTGPAVTEPATTPVEVAPESIAPTVPAAPAPSPQPVASVEHRSAYIVEAEGEDDLPPAVIEFKPRNHIRRVLSVVQLLAFSAAVAAGAIAYQQSVTGLYVVAASLGLLVLVVWAVRASTIPTRLTIRRNWLEVTRSGRRTTIDLASPFTPVAIVGTPGRRGWQVLIEQLEAPVLTLTASDVDPAPFTRVLLRLRPDLRPGPPPTA